MLVNATLLRIDTPAPPTTGGQLQWTNGAALAIRVLIGKDSAASKYPQPQQLTQGRTVSLRAQLPAGMSLAVGQRLSVQLDGDAAPASYRVRESGVRPAASAALSFTEASLEMD